jgi:hypothetical protein
VGVAPDVGRHHAGALLRWVQAVLSPELGAKLEGIVHHKAHSLVVVQCCEHRSIEGFGLC